VLRAEVKGVLGASLRQSGSRFAAAGGWHG